MQPTVPSAYQDCWITQQLPAPHDWPLFCYSTPELMALQAKSHINCVAELFAQVRREGWEDHPCLWLSPQTSWSYAELHQKSLQIAAFLTHDMGLLTGQRVLLRGRNSAMLAACWLGVLLAGAVVVTTHPQWRAEELASVILKTQINYVLCEHELRMDWALAEKISGLNIPQRYWGYTSPDSLENSLYVHHQSWQPVNTAWHDVAILAPTSGSTGQPKITAHSHRDVWAACLCWPQQYLCAQPSDVFIGNASLAFTFGLGGLLLFPMYAGSSIVMNAFRNTQELLAAIISYQATVLMATPTAYRLMMPNAHLLRNHFLRLCVSAGEALTCATHQGWLDATGLPLLNGIGSTEMLHIFISGGLASSGEASLGTAVQGYEACVIDEQGHLVATGKEGYLAVRGPTGCRYLQHELQKQYVKNGWNITGDCVKQDARGHFYFLGRYDDLIISGGNNISPTEVEAALLHHPAVAECAVVGQKDAERGQIVLAYVVLHPGTLANNKMMLNLQNHAKERLAPYKYPRRIIFVDALPRNPSGKLQRHQLATAAIKEEI